jgi:hypothetical protein
MVVYYAFQALKFLQFARWLAQKPVVLLEPIDQVSVLAWQPNEFTRMGQEGRMNLFNVCTGHNSTVQKQHRRLAAA